MGLLHVLQKVGTFCVHRIGKREDAIFANRNIFFVTTVTDCHYPTRGWQWRSSMFWVSFFYEYNFCFDKKKSQGCYSIFLLRLRTMADKKF
jgi:hypothetical protein